MFRTENGKDGTPKLILVPTSNSSSDGERKRERIESYKDMRRRELSAKYGSRVDSTAKSFKSARRKEDQRGGGSDELIVKSCSNSSSSENQVPSSDNSRRYISRRDKNKTEAIIGGNNEVTGNNLRTESPMHSTKESVVLVRETKASRLRAASRSSTSEPGSPSPRAKGPRKTPEREVSLL